ncbi:hypothetical protein EOD42_12010 [Rhodovarius crocodyli]|uniref:Peptidase C13 n=1 Tax=Rhodovarius crocodyli TaxID=1979269 RepID=A0A437MHH7_9PROT|nr:C13 family peptidase [Rhodovarius crocodyli]RVT97108.1 hypothetical protein EOD42_12010 [Rhodovarius crocodyli]
MKRFLMLFLMLPGLALAQPATRWHAVLVAGDPSLEVWDAAVESMASALERGGQMASIRRFSARRDRLQNGAEPATPEGVLRAIAEMRPGPGEACLVFLTMHGAPNQGLVFPLARQAMGPGPLDAALSRGCGQAPTFVIASACYSGGFAQPPMARPNRVVLTAARPDRSSFGCSTQFSLTVFDRCVISALLIGQGGAPGVARTAQDCVAAEERRENMTPPSEPQAYIGPEVVALVPRLRKG